MNSTADRGVFLFAQGTEDGMCHMSINLDGGKPINFQLRMVQLSEMIANLARVLEADRIRIQSLHAQTT